VLKIAVIIGSTRPGRVGVSVAKWVYEQAKQRADAEFELVDIKDFNLPLLDEPVPPSLGQYSKEHTKNWAAKINSFDGYVFVTPEYNHSIPGALKNAIDFVYREWNNKAAGFGSAGGVRAVEHLRAFGNNDRYGDEVGGVRRFSPVHGACRAAVLGPPLTAGAARTFAAWPTPFTGFLAVRLQPPTCGAQAGHREAP